MTTVQSKQIGREGEFVNQLPKSPDYFVEHLKRLGRLLRDTVVRARGSKTGLHGVSRESVADTIYEIDAQVEPALERFCDDWGREMPFVLIAEGMDGHCGTEGMCVFPKGTDPIKAQFRLIVDPIDGTRGLMYDKRSAWVLAGVAPNNGPGTKLSDIQVAMQAEIPCSKQHLADVLWAVAGQGAHGQRDDLQSLKHLPLSFHPSKATSIAHGFASVANFFPGTKVLGSELMEMIAERLTGKADPSKALVFEDQYISTGGQLYEMIVGHDVFVADLRPFFYTIQKQPMGLCCHPYDCAAWLIAKEAGVILTDGLGDEIDGPLDVHTSIAFAAFANQTLRDVVEPLIAEFLLRHGME